MVRCLPFLAHLLIISFSLSGPVDLHDTMSFHNQFGVPEKATYQCIAMLSKAGKYGIEIIFNRRLSCTLCLTVCTLLQAGGGGGGGFLWLSSELIEIL